MRKFARSVVKNRHDAAQPYLQSCSATCQRRPMRTLAARLAGCHSTRLRLSFPIGAIRRRSCGPMSRDC